MSTPFEPTSEPPITPEQASPATPETTPESVYLSDSPSDQSEEGDLSAPYGYAPPVEQISLAQLLGTLLRRPAMTIAGLQEAFARSRAARPANDHWDQPIGDDQMAYEPDDQDLYNRRVTAPRRANPLGALASRSSRARNARAAGASAWLTPALAAEGSYPATPGDLTALFSSTSIAVFNVPTQAALASQDATFSRSGLVALIGMAIGWLITAFGVTFALRNGTSYDNVIAAVFPLAALFVAVGIAVFMAFGLRLMPRERVKIVAESIPVQQAANWLSAHWGSVIVGGVALIATGLAWALNGDNTFTDVGVIAWLLSIFLWWCTFDPALLRFRWLRRGVAWVFNLPSHLLLIRTSWSAVALIAMLIVGGYVRLHELSAYPPDMTSDAVEMVLDTQRVADGARPVFLPTNGGRESAEPYLYVAILHNIFGVPIDYDGLKLLNGIEGIFTILTMYWLARALFDDVDPSFGNLVGLIAAGLVSASYWDIVLSRMGERIVLAPIATCLVCVYFIKSVRYNRLQDYVRCGLAFGISLYTYQSLRILPVMFVICMVITLIMRLRSWRALRRYVLYSLALVIMALAVFMPLARYAVQYPDYFWSRTYGRLFGQDNGDVTVKDPTTGATVTRPATTQDQINALEANIGYLGSNLVRSSLMFTWSGDRSWFTGTNSGEAEMDQLTAALFLIGAALWVVRLFVRRDPADWIVPMTIFAGLLATALALAFTIEVPSATRGSDALPFAYILAGFAGALILRQIWRTFPGWSGRLLAALAVVLAAQSIGTTNVDRYVLEAMADYRNSTLPHEQAGQILKDFGKLYGIGNAFVIAYPYWWDHRALAISADDLNWSNNNGLTNDGGPSSYQQELTTAAHNNYNGPYELRANHPLLFFVNQNDQTTLTSLVAWLPPGTTVEHITSFKPEADFMLVLSAPVDCTWLTLHVAPNNISHDCDAEPVAPATPAVPSVGG